MLAKPKIMIFFFLISLCFRIESDDRLILYHLISTTNNLVYKLTFISATYSWLLLSLNEDKTFNVESADYLGNGQVQIARSNGEVNTYNLLDPASCIFFALLNQLQLCE